MNNNETKDLRQLLTEMEFNYLPWDSDFFNSRIFSIKVSSSSVPELDQLRSTLLEEKADLVYIFVKDAIPEWQEAIAGAGACLYDEKVTYGKKVTEQTDVTFQNVREYNGALNEELAMLALAAGHDSRFKKDSRLNAYFEPFYRLWMTNSLNGTMADKVFVYENENGIEGMATSKIKYNTGSIGLIATKAGARGKGIGSNLIQAVEEFYRSNNIYDSTVVTQATNLQACAFYEKNGFSVIKKEFLYHWWLK